MNTDIRLSMIEKKATLSALWIFFLLNMLFRDIHELFRPGLLEEMISGVVNGTAITDETMLIAGIILQIPLLMVVLSRTLPYRLNRIANIVAPVITIGFTVTNPPRDMDDVWFLIVEMIALLVVVFIAWTWRKPDESYA